MSPGVPAQVQYDITTLETITKGPSRVKEDIICFQGTDEYVQQGVQSTITMDNLSPELCNEILNHLDPSVDRQALTSASLSCRAFTAHAQRLMLRHLTVYGELHIWQMPNTLAGKCLSAVRKLTIVDRHDPEYVPAWPSPLKALRRLFKTCKGIIELEIYTHHLHTTSLRQTRRAKLPFGTVACLLSECRREETEPLFCALEYVHTVSIHEEAWGSVPYYPSFLNCFPRLRHLKVRSGLTPRLHHRAYLDKEAPPVFVLESLTLEKLVEHVRLLDWLRPALRNVHSVTINPFKIQYNGRQGQLERVAPLFYDWMHAIIRMTTYLTIHFIDPCSVLDLQSLTEILNPMDSDCSSYHLRYLNFLGLEFPSKLYSDHFINSYLLSKMSSSESLEQIVFNETYFFKPAELKNRDSDAWAEITDSLLVL